jgi:hypothetical protein
VSPDFNPHHPVQNLSSQMRHRATPARRRATGKVHSLFSVFQIKGWYADEKHKSVLYFPCSVDGIKTEIKDASEALDSWFFSSRSLTELRLPE